MADEPTSDVMQPSLPNDLGHCVTAVVNAVDKVIDEEVEPFGISSLEFAMLRMCLETGGTTARDLTALLPVDASRISRTVEMLVNKGFISRRRSSEDRRIVRLELTEEGIDVTADLIRRVEDRNAVLVAGVTLKEINGFFATSQKIIANFAAEEAAKAALS